jgi:hypothetical protein
MIFDPSGEPAIQTLFDPSDPPLLIEAPDGSAAGVVWLTMARRMQQLCGHDLRGKVIWRRQLPWEGWSLVRMGRFGVVASADGRVLAFDGSGTAQFEGPATGSPSDLFCIDQVGEPLRISRRNVHLICATLDGRVRWRAVSEEPLGPFTAGPAGVAILMGFDLAWFKTSAAGAGPTAVVD